MSRYNTISITRPSLVPNGTEHTAYNDNRPPPRFVVLEDYTSSERDEVVSLRGGDQIEILHCHSRLWIGRTLSYRSRVIAVPPSILKKVSLSVSRASVSSTSAAPSSPEQLRRPASPLLSHRLAPTATTANGVHLPSQEQAFSRSRPSSPTQLLSHLRSPTFDRRFWRRSSDRKKKEKKGCLLYTSPSPRDS